MAEEIKSDWPIFRKEFSSWSMFIDHAANAKTDMPMEDRESRHQKAAGSYESFTKAKSWDHVLELARDGWPEGLKKAKEVSSVLFNHVSEMIEKLNVSYDIEGHSIDIARFVDGEPESWLKFESVLQEAEAGHKLIKITYNVTVSAGVSTDVIIRKGATVAALIELLEYAGHRVELTIVDSSGNSRLEPSHGFVRKDLKPIMLFFVKIKEFDQNLDMNLVSYALSHPSVARALMFSAMETAPENIRKLAGVHKYGFYGTPTDIALEDRGDIHIPHSHFDDVQWATTESAETWVKQKLQEQGVHLKKEN